MPESTGLVWNHHYLKRRGWKESGPGRCCLEALRDSMLSLYVVIEVNPGRSMKLRDLLGDSGTILVQEKSAAKELVMWDCLAARVVSISGRNYMTGGPLPFSPEMSRDFLYCYEDYVESHTEGEFSKTHALPPSDAIVAAVFLGG
ncbi:MAG: hypothetical protein OXD44_09965 [Gammaproteobacteria bacterium]|nr:hypothetical protein [Gammaproteobacteria bacterium]MCY4313994.1 hypothetical protein [Gammaproteobacteria bacterium]